MKKIVYIILLLIILVLGINIGSGNNETNANIIKDKIENYEQGIIENNQINDQMIEPNILNKVAYKCNNLVDKIIKKTIKSIIN